MIISFRLYQNESQMAVVVTMEGMFSYLVTYLLEHVK